jgi:hypothetical protein
VLLPSGTVSTELSVEVQSLPPPSGEVASDHDWRDMESESDTAIDESFQRQKLKLVTASCKARFGERPARLLEDYLEVLELRPLARDPNSRTSSWKERLSLGTDANLIDN